MSRLRMTVLSTAWIVSAIAGYGILGAIIHSYGYWVFAWIPMCVVIAAPFYIYASMED